jgi:hypothetical protein
MDEAGRSCLECRRLHSLTSPCQSIDHPLILRARLLDSGVTSTDPLTDEELEGLKLLCSQCGGFM